MVASKIFEINITKLLVDSVVLSVETRKPRDKTMAGAFTRDSPNPGKPFHLQVKTSYPNLKVKSASSRISQELDLMAEI